MSLRIAHQSKPLDSFLDLPAVQITKQPVQNRYYHTCAAELGNAQKLPFGLHHDWQLVRVASLWGLEHLDERKFCALQSGDNLFLIKQGYRETRDLFENPAPKEIPANKIA